MLKKVLRNDVSNHMLPFFWQHGEDEEILREVIGKIHDAGIGALCVESRPHPDFLGEKWWRDMDIILEECRKRGMEVWIFDDARFPTGYVNGKIKSDFPQYRRWFLKERHIDVLGPVKGASLLAAMRPGDELLAVVAAPRKEGSTVDHSTHVNVNHAAAEEPLIDLTQRVQEDVVYWDIPEGYWRVFYLYTSHDSGRGQSDWYLNPITAEGTQVLIDTVYEAHYQRYGKDFGKTIRGFFSDEPQLANAYGYHASIGRYPFMPLPWSKDMPKLLEKALGEDYIRFLPGLWYDIGESTPKVRHAYMDAMTRLYEENFCNKIGDWCRDHGVEYIGHVIEENNCHARLGNGTGHYFRSTWGQDMAGIDVVLHEIIPGIKGSSHSWASRDFEADDEFFYYALGQLATSIAHIDPKKKGRAMCEIFGAYGWQCGLRQMKWLADFFLSRGINEYIPHAFSPKDFPDPDCPPHFYARGHNPQYRYFKLLMDYMNRVSTLISDGTHIANAAVLYHAEAEWAGDYMKFQSPMRVLQQHQIDGDVIPVDALEDADAQDGRLKIHQEFYDVLIIPYVQYMSNRLLQEVRRLREADVPVLMVNAYPEAVFDDPSIDASSCLSSLGCKVVDLEELAEKLFRRGFYDIRVADFEPDLKSYHYRKGSQDYYLFFNESLHRVLDVSVTFREDRNACLYDAMENRAWHFPLEKGTGRLILPPYGAVVVAFGVPEEFVSQEPPRGSKTVLTLDGDWEVYTVTAKEYPNFSLCKEIKGTGNLNTPQGLPRFSGTLAYEKAFVWESSTKVVTLDLGEVGETAEVWVNGQAAGVRITPPYVFDISDLLVKGKNTIRVEVTNTLVYQEHDFLSGFQPIYPSGLIGPVRLLVE
ncbi:MAG: glycosylhydrolase-like jelly roll fold domain-containing protein [Clostridia bacterium]|jgi:hypothetical protein